ncbi:MAG TPA: class I SAM-dependent methyltransferase [Allosphingosinicella sp.]|nr:class I SAM-dependent methyltransferase [Allosphingosinicella sp.]
MSTNSIEKQAVTGASSNFDAKTVEGFGEEWATFDQSPMDADEWQRHFEGYFSIFPFDRLPPGAEGFDLGCGSGRWARGVAPRVGTLHCIDPSDKALAIAKANLAAHDNVVFHLAGADAMPLPDSSQDFGYSLGVLHHIPDTLMAMRCCVAKLKPDAPFLVYLYYALDERPSWFRQLWRASDVLRRGVSKLPFRLRKRVTDVIAASIYFPLTRVALAAERLGFNVDDFPLSSYRKSSFYMMRTDALDRFGTRLEQRFTKEQIRTMMQASGLHEIAFSETGPFWIACGRRL